MAIRITNGPAWVSADVCNATVEQGESREVIFTFDATGLEEGTYEANAVILCNDPDEHQVVLPIQMTVDEDGVGGIVALPYETTLHANYPNPFNPATTLRFNLAQQEQVSLEVYNLLGQRVAVLVNETMDAGAYQVTWNTSGMSNIASGMYYCRMQAGGYHATRKMMLIK